MIESKNGETKLSQRDMASLGGHARARKLSEDDRKKIAIKASKAAAQKRKTQSKKKKEK